MAKDYPDKNIGFVRAVAQHGQVALHTHQIGPGGDEYATPWIFSGLTIRVKSSNTGTLSSRFLPSPPTVTRSSKVSAFTYWYCHARRLNTTRATDPRTRITKSRNHDRRYFEVYPAAGKTEQYLDIAAELKPLLAEIDGFISIERFASLSVEGKVLSLSFWRDEQAIADWRKLELMSSAIPSFQ